MRKNAFIIALLFSGLITALIESKPKENKSLMLFGLNSKTGQRQVFQMEVHYDGERRIYHESKINFGLDRLAGR